MAQYLLRVIIRHKSSTAGNMSRSFQMPITKMLKFHGQHDGAKRLISFQTGGYPWPTAYNRNFTKETSRASGGEATSDHPHPHPHSGPHVHWVFPWIHVHHMGETNFTPAHLFPAIKINSPHRPHPVEPNTSYRMWGLVSRQNDSLVQRDSASSYVNCKGTFSDKTGNTEITTSDINQDYVSLLFKDPTTLKKYVVTAQADPRGNISIEAVATASGQQYSDEAKFKPFYYWSYIIFQNKWFNTKYLSCDSTGNMTLVDMAELDYPNPQALFILNKV